ncbi:MAG TPA: lytic transglycosylase domain-containing protein [Deltaproteobacteria bacterium]|nr:lytic transglycosylase domain-containing protein [Deltaproteobacteria bacterium]HQI81468.1 lytic transglycosylase domain-containing protein [Deltaproteobacteria bacterium]
MKVSSPDVMERLIRSLPSGGIQGRPASAPGEDAFSSLLERAASRATDAAPASVDREKIAALLELVRIRMSQSVMNAFTDGTDDDALQGMPSMPALLDLQGASNYRHKVEPPDSPAAPRDLDAIINRASSTYGVDRDLIVSVIRAESGFDATATSPKGAMGLMQLMPATARDLGVTNAYDPDQNVMAGTRYLKGLLDRYGGDVRKALAAYNWGMGNLERSTGGLPEETRNYIARIMRDYTGA